MSDKTPGAVAAAPASKGKPVVAKSLGELAMMDLDELKEEAAARDIDVRGVGFTIEGEGKDAKQVPVATTRADYIKALTSGAASGKFDETIPGGRYVDAAGNLVNAHGQKINKDGTMADPNETPKSSAGIQY